MARSIVLVALIASFACAFAVPVLEQQLATAFFESWATSNQRSYVSGSEEYKLRLNTFLSNLDVIANHNAGDSSYTLGLTAFADMTFEEFKGKYLMTGPQECSATKGTYMLSSNIADLPKRVDWREKGVVTPVKDQGHCGSCWTFSTTGCLESHTAIKYGKLLLLSEQQLVDCAQAFDNNGCEGGLPSHAFEYIHYNGGIMSEDGYPYRGDDGACQFNSSGVVATSVRAVNITEGAETTELIDAVATQGPVSIAFEVASDFHLYAGGIYDSTVCRSGPNDVNHAVLAVGYDEDEDGTRYWIIKNSWGESWGIDGYFHMVYGKNMCGISTCASFVEV
eukprot:Colp12_sorted_trinity150504_noHs@23033